MVVLVISCVEIELIQAMIDPNFRVVAYINEHATNKHSPYFFSTLFKCIYLVIYRLNYSYFSDI